MAKVVQSAKPSRKSATSQMGGKKSLMKDRYGKK